MLPLFTDEETEKWRDPGRYWAGQCSEARTCPLVSMTISCLLDQLQSKPLTVYYLISQTAQGETNLHLFIHSADIC